MLSILMVTWNRLEYTKQAVASYLRNTDVPFELVIVDNGSVDGTPEYLWDLRREDHVRVVFLSRNMGLAFAINRALEDSYGDMICFTANDVVVPFRWASVLLGAFDTFQEVIGGKRIGWMNPLVFHCRIRLPGNQSYRIGRYMIETSSVVSGVSGVMERSVLEQVGGFYDSGFKYGGVDWFTMCRMRDLGFLTCWLENVMVVTLELEDDTLPEYKAWKRAVQLRIHGGSIPVAREFVWVEE